MLRSDDLNDQGVIEDQLRWWHNRAVHNAYGIAAGLEARASQETGALWKIKITPGIAYDCFGRELILTREGEIAVPSGGEAIPSGGSSEKTFVLLARFSRPHSEHGGCELFDASSSQNHDSLELVLKWGPDRLTKHDGVPIATIKRVITNTTSGTSEGVTVDGGIRPIVRPIARPHIANGATQPGATQWELWKTQTEDRVEVFVGFQVRVDTSAAGFVTTPCYFAWMPTLFLSIDEVAESSADGFTCRLINPYYTGYRLTGNPALEAWLLNSGRASPLSVCWIGVEMKRAEEPGAAPAIKGPLDIIGDVVFPQMRVPL
jgi:hypothetical protein